MAGSKIDHGDLDLFPFHRLFSPVVCYPAVLHSPGLLRATERNISNLQKKVNTKIQKIFTIALPHRLKELRATETQAEMAKKLNVKQQTYARWELGDRQPKLQDLCAIALHFGVKTDWLLGLTESSVEDSVTDLQKRYQAAQQQLTRVNKALGFILKGANELQSIIEVGSDKV